MAGNDGRGSHSVPAMGLMHLDHFQPGSQQILLATRPSPSSHTAAFAPGRSFALSGASKLFAVTPAILAACRLPPAALPRPFLCGAGVTVAQTGS